MINKLDKPKNPQKNPPFVIRHDVKVFDPVLYTNYIYVGHSADEICVLIVSHYHKTPWFTEIKGKGRGNFKTFSTCYADRLTGHVNPLAHSSIEDHSQAYEQALPFGPPEG